MFNAAVNPVHSYHVALRTMADGTLKQVNPFSETEVWTVPGRGNRPLSHRADTPAPLAPSARTDTCNFCEARKLRTPPEKSRLVATDSGFEILRDVMPDDMDTTRAEFRRVPNLFEIVSYDYWRENYGYAMPPARREHMERYLADDTGRAHVLDIVRTRLAASGQDPDISEDGLLQLAPSYFGGGHDVIIARRHYADGAENTDQLAGSGALTPEEHYRFIAFTVDSLRDLVEQNSYARYVVVFQNWLAPAGASFEHLHKQLVAIDERGVNAETETAKLRQNLNLYNDWGVNHAFYRNLVIAETDHAILVAGVGHRYPTMTVYSKSAACEPWLHSEAETRGVSDLLHAAHAATGTQVATNEEWHYKPVDLDVPMPWRINVKWRISTVAGFEGGTQIYVNTLSPFDVRDRVTATLRDLRHQGAIAPHIRIAEECTPAPNLLRYNPNLER